MVQFETGNTVVKGEAHTVTEQASYCSPSYQVIFLSLRVCLECISARVLAFSVNRDPDYPFPARLSSS